MKPIHAFPPAFYLFGAMLICCVVYSGNCVAADDVPDADSLILPQIELFPPLLADQREYTFSIRYEDRRQEGTEFKAAEVSFGDSLPIKDFSLDANSKFQITFDGVFYSLYNLETSSDDLINSDFLVGSSLVYRNQGFGARLRVRHKSSHLGDEYVLHNPGVDRENSSFEEVRLLPAYEWENARVYSGGGTIFRGADHNKRWNLQFGAEAFQRSRLSQLEFFAASDFQSEERVNWRVVQTYRTGILLGERNSRNIRFALEYVNGYAQDGQFVTDNLQYYGAAVYFQL